MYSRFNEAEAVLTDFKRECSPTTTTRYKSILNKNNWKDHGRSNNLLFIDD